MNYSYLDKKEEFGKVNTFPVYAQKRNKQDLGYYVQGRGGNYFCSDMNLPTPPNLSKIQCAENPGLCPYGQDRPYARTVFYNDGITPVGPYGACQDKVAGPGDDGEIGGKIFCSDGTNDVVCCPDGYTLGAGIINGLTQLICDSKAPAPPHPPPDKKITGSITLIGFGNSVTYYPKDIYKYANSTDGQPSSKIIKNKGCIDLDHLRNDSGVCPLKGCSGQSVCDSGGCALHKIINSMNGVTVQAFYPSTAPCSSGPFQAPFAGNMCDNAIKMSEPIENGTKKEWAKTVKSPCAVKFVIKDGYHF